MTYVAGLIEVLLTEGEPVEQEVAPVTARIPVSDVRALDWLGQQLGSNSRSSLAADLLQAAIQDAAQVYLARFGKEDQQRLHDELNAFVMGKGGK